MHRPVDDESLGIRVHEVNRQRAVDRAIERLRHGLRADWFYLTADDHSNLRWVLGELWAVSSREAWESFHFSKLDIEDTRRLVNVGDRLRRHGTSKMDALGCATALIHTAAEADAIGTSDLDGAALAY